MGHTNRPHGLSHTQTRIDNLFRGPVPERPVVEHNSYIAVTKSDRRLDGHFSSGLRFERLTRRQSRHRERITIHDCGRTNVMRAATPNNPGQMSESPAAVPRSASPSHFWTDFSILLALYASIRVFLGLRVSRVGGVLLLGIGILLSLSL